MPDIDKSLVQEMDTLGYEFVQLEGYSDDFLMWKSKDEVDTKNAFGFDGWEAVREFTNNVHTLMNNYTVQVLQDRMNKNYSVIDYGSFDDREIQTAIKNYLQQKAKNNDITYTKVQTENDKSEPNNSINIENPILASFYDKYNQKIAKFEDKNTNLNAKIDKLNYKITKATDMQSKLSQHESRIADNNKKIHKYESKITLCKKINTFLTNMKTQDGRKENFINGVQEFRSIAIRNASEKFDVTQEKLNKAMSEYGKTHFASEKLKLQKQINNLANKKDKLRDKLIALDALVDKFDTINKMSEQKIENVIEQSCDNIVSDLTGKKSVKAETVVNACSKAIDSSIAQEKDNYLKNAEMSVEDDYDSIDGIINNGNKQEEYKKMEKTQYTEPENKEISEDKSSDNDNTRFTVYENFSNFGNFFSENKLAGEIDKKYTIEFGKIKNVEFFENQRGNLMYKSTGKYGDEFISSVAESLKETRDSNAIQLIITYADGYRNGFQQLNTIKVNPEKVFDGDGDVIFDKAEHNAEKKLKQQKKSLISRKQIKQNADKIAHTHNEQLNNTKSKGQEL